MKFLLIPTLFIATVLSSQGQSSGSGTLEWWTATCGGICTRHIDNEDIYWIVAPQDGDVEISGSTTGLTAFCNNCSYTSSPIPSAVFRSNGFALGSFSSSPTITVSCLAAGDSVGVRFFTIGSGYYGNYSFTSTFTPKTQGNDMEPNNTKETAQIIPSNSTVINGHIYYGSVQRDASDYFELGTFEVGDSIHWSITGDAGYFSLQRLGEVAGINIGDLVNSQATITGHHIVSHDDTYFISVISLGSAPCGYYEITLSGDRGHREYTLSSDCIDLNYYPIEDMLYIGGDFTAKTIHITNTSNTVVQNLTGSTSPIMFDKNALPAGKHFIVISDQNNAQLAIQNLIKE